MMKVVFVCMCVCVRVWEEVESLMVVSGRKG